MKFSENRIPDFFFGAVFSCGCLVGLATLCGFLAPVHWFFDLFTHFRVQMTLCLFLAAFLFLFSARRKFSLLFLAMTGVHLLNILPFYVPPAGEPGAGEEPLKLILANVNSRRGDPERVLEYLRDSQADVVVIQEFSFRWQDMLRELTEMYPHQISERREDNFGMAVISRRPFRSKEIFYFTGELLPSIGVELSVGNDSLFLLGLHPVPPMGKSGTDLRNLELREAARFLSDIPGPVLLAGDLNTTPWSPSFKELLKSSGLKNSMQGFGLQPTWPVVQPVLFIPLDHVLYRGELDILDRRTGPDIGSDHLPVEVTLRFFSAD